MKSIPILYHPTTITLIDDDQNLLDSLNLFLSEYFKCKSFVSAIDGKNYLLEEQKKVTKKYLTVGYEDTFSNVSIDLEISKIREEVYNKARFSYSIIAIIDYDMPEMNGLDLARELKEKTNVKVIMLTGEADKNTAVTAFNNGEIDRFLQKSTPDYQEKLLESIQQLQVDSFSEVFSGLRDSLSSKESHPLKDIDFIHIFKKICDENSIIEYYLIDESGSFLMFDSEGNPAWLIVRTDKDMQTFYELADGERASKTILHALEKREQLAFFIDQEDAIPPISQWHFYPATQIKNKKIYYCFLKNNESGIAVKKIASYEQFLHS